MAHNWKSKHIYQIEVLTIITLLTGTPLKKPYTSRSPATLRSLLRKNNFHSKNGIVHSRHFHTYKNWSEIPVFFKLAMIIPSWSSLTGLLRSVNSSMCLFSYFFPLKTEKKHLHITFTFLIISSQKSKKSNIFLITSTQEIYL